MPRNSECRLESFEPPRPQEALPQDQKRPAVSDYPNGTGKRTRLFLKGIPFHSGLQSSVLSIRSNQVTKASSRFILIRHLGRDNHPQQPINHLNNLVETKDN